MLTISDSIAFKILNENTLLAGVGNEIRVFSSDGGRTLPFKLKGKVHGIEYEETSNKILIYGEHEFVLVEQSETGFQLLYRGSLSDWISSGRILRAPGLFLLVTAHSVALLFRYDEVSKDCEIQTKSSCTDKSTLYCSYVYGSTWEESLILGGNAFGELLVWQPSVKSTENDGKAKLLHRISGHNGVIFSIDIDIESKLLVTTSDDRSIRFWDINTIEGDDGYVDFKRSKFTPRKSGYSHTARVFKGKIIHECGETYAVTGGEDSYICLWNRECELLFKRRQQFGATIWSLDYHSPTKTLFTSGSSGNVLKYGLQDYFNCRKSTEGVLTSQSLDFSEYIAKVKFLNERNLIGITNKNRLMTRNGLRDGDWVVIENVAPYKCTVLEVYGEYVAVAGYQKITLYKFDEDSLLLEQIYHGNVLPGVIRSFIFLSQSEFLISDESGICKFFRGTTFHESLSIELPQCKERWVTTACKVDAGFLIISNRQGNLMLYFVSEEGTSPKLCDTVKRLHGHLGATTITAIKESEHFCILRSTGHDSTIKTIKLDKNQKHLSVLYRENIPIAWVEKAVIFNKNNELFFGFNDNHFVLWSREEDTHFETPCGGGHRCWDLHLNLSENQCSMVFIKNKKVILHQEAVFNKTTMSLDIPRNKWHVRPCNVLRSFKGREALFLASGGDDNLLKVSKFNLKSGTLIQIHETYSHISSIRGLCVWSVESGDHLIFSCGGRAQICVTVFQEDTQIFEDIVDYSIQKEKPSQNIRFDPETRVMSIDVRHLPEDLFEIFAGCSDGYVRKFIMEKKSAFTLVAEVFYGRCILHVRVAGDCLLTIATDGVVCFWKIDPLEIDFKVTHHESGVNGFDVRVINEREFHLLTGGDDQRVVYSRVIQIGDTFEVQTLRQMDYLHTAQVTAVKFSPCMLYFFSSSVDQVVRRVDLKTFESTWEAFSCVADVKEIDVIQEINSKRLIGFLYGCGLQVLDLSDSFLTNKCLFK